MPRTKEANELVKNKRKQIILDNALRLFCLNGYENVTMDQIAKEAKISHGLIYHYFKDKTDILGTLTETGKSKLNESLIDQPSTNLKGKDFYLNMTNFIFDCCKKGEEYVYYMYLFLTFRYSIREYQEYSHLKFFKQFEDEFKYAQENGDFQDGNPKEFISCYFVLLQSIVHEIMLYKNKIELPSTEVIMNLMYKKKEGI